MEAVGTALSREQVPLVNAAIWGFLSGRVYGAAEEIFKRADRRVAPDDPLHRPWS